MATTRAIAWVKDEPVGIEFADVLLEKDRLMSSGVAIGSGPVPYRLDYTLETTAGFVTSRMHVTAHGQGWKRLLELRRSETGAWTAGTEATGHVDLKPVGGDMVPLAGALDCDLALSPLTNSMPVLRHGILSSGGPVDFVMAWISVPDLGIHVSRQRYKFIRTDGGRSVISYESIDSDFTADITFDRDGLVLDYPGIGHRLP